ncbi:hypothetical protein DC522_32655 [Microvirga sp. KLBC 81]|nr:hypothetical protein DC522_32655 [Microvirga sp. KLBC 81]
MCEVAATGKVLREVKVASASAALTAWTGSLESKPKRIALVAGRCHKRTVIYKREEPGILALRAEGAPAHRQTKLSIGKLERAQYKTSKLIWTRLHQQQ